MQRLKIVCKEIRELDKIAERIIDFGKKYKIWLFNGELGSGKTTLIKAICLDFGVDGYVTSPTFSLVNEYSNRQGDVFYHFDFYRIKDKYEAIDIGAEEYFYSGNYCFIEWPQKVLSLIPDSFIQVDIKVITDNQRVIELINNG